MEPRYRFRLFILTALILAGFGILLSRLYEYQIVERDYFRKQVPHNQTITIREPGIRGEIQDRNGVVLAQNLPNFELVFNLQEIRDNYKRYLIKTKGKDAVKNFENIKTHEIINLWIRPRLAYYGLDRPYRASALDTHYITHGGLVPFTFRDDLTQDEFIYFAEHNLELPGVSIRVSPRRDYPFGSLASHILGYIKQWEKGSISPEEKRKFKHYTGDPKGIAGVESTMNLYLTGEAGTRTLLKNEKGEVLREVDRTKSDVGATVKLTIDARVQCAVENALRHVGRAAAVVMDPNTGEILAMASVPDFTPSFFVPSIDPVAWKNYNTNKARPLINKAINNFTPGSTFKLPTAITGAIHGHASESQYCPGYNTYGKIKIRCWKHSGHGQISLEPAIQQSCNVYFMKIANEVGSSNMLKGFELLGLGHKTGVELPSESSGIVPGSRYWRQVLRPGKKVTPSITGMMAIGQSDCAATPLQLAAIVSAIANGGKYYKPRIIKTVIHPHQGILIKDTPKLKVDLLKEGLSAKDLEHIRHGMWMAVNKPRGTARRAAVKGRDVSAKTGTAQTVDMGIKSHDAWTVAFAPYDHPRYVVVVAVHRGEHGGTVAAPIVHLILRGLFAQDDGIKLPLVRMTESQGDFEVRSLVKLPEGEDFIDQGYNRIAEQEQEETNAEDLGLPKTKPILVKPNIIIPKPTIKQKADAEGSKIPKAIIIEED